MRASIGPSGRVSPATTRVNHGDRGIRPWATWHSNTVEGYFSILKRGIYGCYFHVSEAHLHRYLAEFDFSHSNRIGAGRR